MIDDKRVLLIIGGGIAAYKSLDLIRQIAKCGGRSRVILTAGGAQFVTPLSVGALSNDRVYGELFSLTDEAEMGHIRLSREADLVVVAPATADLLAKMANGHADDLAATALLATDKRVLVAPAMNPMMWANPATQRNVKALMADGVRFVGPDAGDMACGEIGPGRMAEAAVIAEAIETLLASAVSAKPLTGTRALVTSGPTHEPLDPVRYLANRSSGKQGHAIAAALHEAGAAVTLVTGPVRLPDPQGVAVEHIESAADMLAACAAALPVDIAVCAAAVADWRPVIAAGQKLKKGADGAPAVLQLVENPDILQHLSRHPTLRPRLVIGFAAETEDVLAHASAKRARKGCDWLLANDVSTGSGTFGGDDNTVHVLRGEGEPLAWPTMSKRAVAEALVKLIAEAFATKPLRATP